MNQEYLYTTLYQVKKVQLEEVKERGFLLKEEEKITSFSLEEFIDFFSKKSAKGKSLRSLLSNTYKKDEKTLVVAFLDIKSRTIKDEVSRIMDEALKNKSEIIIIGNGKLSRTVQTIFEDYPYEKEFFLEEEWLESVINDELFLSRILKTKKTQIEMVSDRGFTIPSEEKLIYEMTLTEFIEKNKDKGIRSLNRLLSKTYHEGDRKLFVNFMNSFSKTLGVSDIRGYLKYCELEKIKEGIIISNVPLSSSATNSLKEVYTVNTQVFLQESLLYNPTKHIFVPKHSALSKEEGAELLAKLRTKRENLPILKKMDPIARYYDFKSGQIIKIERKNFVFDTIVEDSIFYRIVL